MTRTEAIQSALIRWLDTNRVQIDAMRRGEKLALEVLCQSGGQRCDPLVRGVVQSPLAQTGRQRGSRMSGTTS